MLNPYPVKIEQIYWVGPKYKLVWGHVPEWLSPDSAFLVVSNCCGCLVMCPDGSAGKHPWLCSKCENLIHCAEAGNPNYDMKYGSSFKHLNSTNIAGWVAYWVNSDEEVEVDWEE